MRNAQKPPKQLLIAAQFFHLLNLPLWSASRAGQDMGAKWSAAGIAEDTAEDIAEGIREDKVIAGKAPRTGFFDMKANPYR